jgi:hypothetical protein
LFGVTSELPKVIALLILRSSKKPLQKLIIGRPLEKRSSEVSEYARGASYDNDGGESLPGSLHQGQHKLQPKGGL